MSVGARNRRIDLLRGVSILLVLFHHFNIAYPLKDTALATAVGWSSIRAVARNGNYGVTIFFVISGFLITSNAIRRWGRLEHIRLPGFYALRAGRIVPCVVLLLLMVNLLAAAGIPIFQNRGGGQSPVPLWIVNLAALTSWMNVLIARHGWVNYPLGVLWSLSVEEMFYLLFPVSCLLLRRKRLLLLFWALVILAGPLYRLLHQGDEGGFLYAYLACFDGIAIGCCAAVAAAHASFPLLARPWVRAALTGAMGLLYLSWPIGQSNGLGVSAMSVATALLLLGASTARLEEPPTRATEPVSVVGSVVVSVLAACGRLSYELYLFHLVVLGLIRTAYPPAIAAGDERIWLMGAYVLLSLGLSAAIARGYTEPLNRAVRRWVEARSVQVRPPGQ
ncbi:acyltransferase family protein [Azospirillum endophyticum]